MNERLRFGIIGYGAQGSTYASFIEEGMAPSMELKAFCDIDETKQKELKEKYPNKKIFKDYKEMIDSGEVEAIITTVPHYIHPEISMYALKKGIHVLNEKPAGVYTKQVKALNALAEKTPETTYAIMFNQRNNPLYKKIKQIIDAGEIGPIRRTNWIITTWWRPQPYYDQSAWRATWGGEGGGVLVNQAPHQLDLIQWIAGIPTSVYSKVQHGFRRDIAVEDEVTTMMTYKNGATGVFVTCTHDILGTDRLEILGDKGKIIVEDSKTVTVKRLKESENTLNKNMDMEDVKRLFMGELDTESLYSTETFTEESAWGEQHAGVLENFARHVLYDEELLAPGAEGINGVRLANAIHLSSWTGEEISIEDFDDERYLSELNKRIKAENQFQERQ